jgi:hypothetical protein
MLASMIRAEIMDNAYFNAIFECIKKLKIKKKTSAYSSLLNVVLRTKNWWQGFKDFCKWWNFDNFTDEDFQNTETSSQNGKKIMSLAERIVMAYCKNLLETGTDNEINDFLPWLENFSINHKNFIFLPFYNAKLMWKIGKKDEFFEKMKIFAKKKSGDFWVWDLLGDYYDDKNMRLKFYAKGLSCKSKAEMSIKLREKTAWLLKDLGFKKEALGEFLFIKKIKEKNKWKILPELESAISEFLGIGIKAEKNNIAFYEKMSTEVEEIVFGKKQNKPTKKDEQKEEQFDFEGKIKISPNGFGFVRSNGKTIFVTAKLITDNHIDDNSVVKGKFIKSFDKKKNKDGYKAIKIVN